MSHPVRTATDRPSNINLCITTSHQASSSRHTNNHSSQQYCNALILQFARIGVAAVYYSLLVERGRKREEDDLENPGQTFENRCDQFGLRESYKSELESNNLRRMRIFNKLLFLAGFMVCLFMIFWIFYLYVVIGGDFL